MKKIFAFCMVFFFVLTSGCLAQFSGQLSTAKVTKEGGLLGGGYIGIYEDAFSIFGQVRYGFITDLDGGFKLGILNLDPGEGFGESETGVILGGDIKYQILNLKVNDPLDFSFGFGMEYLNISDYSLFSFGGNLVGSYDFELKSKKVVTPYGRLNLRGERVEVSIPGWTGSKDDTDFDIAFSLGCNLQMTSELSMIAELQIDDNVGVIGGISYYIF
ncbi:MAG: hypothetical protein MUO85_04550 [candidate division Zixibacteria bacterium]|nr:hypothetical protein [candidate division Zixibacteria bacterium]